MQAVRQHRKKTTFAAAMLGLAAIVAFLILWLGPAPSGDVFAAEGTGQASTDIADATIVLRGDDVSVIGTGVSVDGRIVTIASAGTYLIRGELTDGRFVVDAGDGDDVTLVLEGARISCTSFSPLYVANADEVILLLADGTSSYIEDGDTYELDAGADEPNAAIFSADDLTICGNGSLTVIANYNNGIQSKDDLLIESGRLVVTAVNDGLKGRDSLTVRDADIIVDAGADGLQSNNAEDPAEGTITVESGTIEIDAGADGIQAETALVVEGGTLTIVTGGGSANSSTVGGDTGMVNRSWGNWASPGASSTVDTASAKGLKAGSSLTITGGTIDIDSSDDCIHSNDTLRIDDGQISLLSGDDGIHADTSLEINGGDITIGRSYEGIESMDISLNGGTIHVTASDDGINAAGGNDASALGGRPGQNMFSESTNCTMTISGGYIYVDAIGDGLDINGPITMTGGTVVLHAPTDDRDGALDWTGSFDISGGYLIAAGSYGRTTQAPSGTSSQNSVMVNLTSSVPAGTLIHIDGENGEDIVTFEPTKTYQSFLLSSAELEAGAVYTVYVGGTVTGESRDGLYRAGSYSAGTNLGSFTLSGTVTWVGSASQMPGGRF